MPDLPDQHLDTSKWRDFYPSADELDEKPPRMPKPLGKAVRIFCYVDADHAGDQANRRSYTGIIMMINRAFVSSFSKRQNTAEAATFGLRLLPLGLRKRKYEPSLISCE